MNAKRSCVVVAVTCITEEQRVDGDICGTEKTVIITTIYYLFIYLSSINAILCSHLDVNVSSACLSASIKHFDS